MTKSESSVKKAVLAVIAERTEAMFERLAEHSPMRTDTGDRIGVCVFLTHLRCADKMAADTDLTAELKCEALEGILPSEAECYGAASEAGALLDVLKAVAGPEAIESNDELKSIKDRLELVVNSFDLMTGQVGPSWWYED